jgi:hypothetical protein
MANGVCLWSASDRAKWEAELIWKDHTHFYIVKIAYCAEKAPWSPPWIGMVVGGGTKRISIFVLAGVYYGR